MKVSRIDLASLGLVLGQFGLAAAIAALGPTHPLPMHFGADGTVDRWGGRLEMALVVLVVAVIATVVLAGRWLTGRHRDPEVARGFARAQFGVLLFLSLIGLMAASMTWGWIAQPGPTFGMVMICVALAFVGGLMGKVRPNALMGVRTPWTFGSRLAWDKANRLAGRLFFWGGLAGLATAPFVPQPDGFQAVRYGVLAIAVITVVESWRVWLTDPERRAGR